MGTASRAKEIVRSLIEVDILFPTLNALFHYLERNIKVN